MFKKLLSHANFKPVHKNREHNAMTVALWNRHALGTEQVVSSSPGSVGYYYPMFIQPTITRVPSGFSGYIWLDANKLC